MAVIDYYRTFVPRYFPSVHTRRGASAKIHEFQLPVSRVSKGVVLIDDEQGVAALMRHAVYPPGGNQDGGIGDSGGRPALESVRAPRGPLGEDEIAEALRAQGGSQSDAARALSIATGARISRQRLHERVRRSPRLQAVIAGCQQATTTAVKRPRGRT